MSGSVCHDFIPISTVVFRLRKTIFDFIKIGGKSDYHITHYNKNADNLSN